MLTRTEAERLAQAVHALRPDWRIDSLLTFLGKHKTRPLRDVALELVYVAIDPDTKTPARIEADGPWKSILRLASPMSQAPRITDTHCAICFRPKDAVHADHEYEPQHVRAKSTGVTDEQRKAMIPQPPTQRSEA